MSSEEDIKHSLDELGVDILEPSTKKEQTMAEALEAFAQFVLTENEDESLSILEKHMGQSVGELQGGNGRYSIYRVKISDDDGNEEVEAAAAELLTAFFSSYRGKRYTNVLTALKLQQYMLGMCERRRLARRHRDCGKIERIGNFMFIVSFGPTAGQIRHIDDMSSNTQICLYMSTDCPSTVVYSPEGPPITSGRELVEHWETAFEHVPTLLKDVLVEQGNVTLGDKLHTKYFASWDTIDATLACFGKLYQPVSRELSLRTDPGSTLLAGGNEIHAGPSTSGARMFAFGVGIPEESKGGRGESKGDEDNDGEVQYSPVLLHLDLCCILLSVMDFQYSDRKDEHPETKQFLLDLLAMLVRDAYPKEDYALLMNEERRDARGWLCKLVSALEDEEMMDALIQEAIESELILQCPSRKVSNSKKRRAVKRNKRRYRI